MSCLSGLGVICLVCLSFLTTSYIASVLCTCISMYTFPSTSQDVLGATVRAVFLCLYHIRGASVVYGVKGEGK